MTVKIVCYSGGKDSTAMLIHLLETNAQIDDIIYVDVGNWIWDSSKKHLKDVQEKLGVKINIINVEEDIKKGFLRWGFPSFMNRWCTGIKRDSMRDYIKERYNEGEREHLVQYIGYCSDEEKRTNKKLYSSFDVEYPLVEANITTSDALQMCYDYGFDFGGVYEHHSHYNCWLCPLQQKKELYEIYKRYPKYWEQLRQMQHQTHGYYQNGKTIFEFEKDFWEKGIEELKENQKQARLKYNKR